MEYTKTQFRGSAGLLLVMLAVVAFGFSSSDAAPMKKSVAISFIDLGVVTDWQPEGQEAILIETIHKRWYRAEFVSPCVSLPWQQSVGFVTSPKGQLNRFSSIVTDTERCHFRNLEEIPNPLASADE